MKYILKFIISLCLLLVSAHGFSQQDSLAVKTDSLGKPVIQQRYGLRIGVDLYRLARTIYDDDFKGIEIMADYRYSKKFYIAAEAGTVDFTVDDTQLNFTTKGTYLKIGFDYNAYENWLDMENMIYAGMRYGVSGFSQNLNSYKIYDNSSYFEEVTVYPNNEYKGLTAHWLEIVGGVKAELFNNVFLGFSVRLNYLVGEKKPDGFDNLYIPGFNRTYDGKFGVGFNYGLSYFIPIYKKDK